MDLGGGIRKALARITGAALVDEKAVKELVRELQRVLITNDVNVKLVLQLSKDIEKRTLEEKLPPGLSLRERVVKVVYEELVRLLGGQEVYEPVVGKQRILLLGLFGAGKTSSCGKLARFYSKRGLKVALVAGDVHRPAAFEQLQQIAESVGAGFYGKKGEKDVAKIASYAVEHLTDFDVLIFDSAGRSAFDAELAGELKRVNDAFKPNDKFLVVSADIGQVAGRQAKEFNDAVGVSGVVVTKMDGSGKGGGALSAVCSSQSRVTFIGVGEKPDALEVFDAKRFVGRLSGFPDLKSLLEKVSELNKEEQLQKALEEGKLDFDTFLTQMKAMKKMGPLKQIMQMMGVYDLPEELVGKSEEKMKSFEAAVLSMTPKERRETKLMKNRSRQERVASGAGLKPDAVRELVSNFERVHKMMKGMRGNRGMMKHFQKMMPKFKGFTG
ncbi:MAG: signal recognition particle receptor subunit alpha [Candidatus Micrarchaeia archaeon]